MNNYFDVMCLWDILYVVCFCLWFFYLIDYCFMKLINIVRLWYFFVWNLIIMFIYIVFSLFKLCILVIDDNLVVDKKVYLKKIVFGLGI